MPPELPALSRGESILGIAARYHRLAGHLRFQDTLQVLFGTRHAKPANMLPSHLQWMATLLKYPGSVQGLIEAHTALPYFRCFVAPTTYAQVLAAMAGPTAGGCKLTLGLVASRLGGSNHLAFCPACAEHDFASLGVATWYRDAQLPGVLVCAQHRRPLVGLPAQPIRRHPHRLPLPDDLGERCVSLVTEDVSLLVQQRLSQIAAMSAELLNEPAYLTYTTLRWRYAAWLLQMGLAKQPTYIDQRTLVNAVAAYWQPLCGLSPFDHLLSDLQQREGHWLATLCRHQRATHHPLKHLLLMGYLAPSIQAFLSIEPASPPRAAGTASVKPPYQDERLTQLSSLLENEPMSLRQAADRLGLSPQTVIVLAHRLHIPVKRRPKRLNARTYRRLLVALSEPRALTAIAKAHHTSLSTLYRLLAANPTTKTLRQQRLQARQRLAERASLRHLRHQHRTATWQQLRHQAPAACVWLARHDQSWLESFKLTLSHTKEIRRQIVDWSARDRAMVLALQTATRSLQSTPGKPCRISLAALAELVEHPDWLDKQLDRLPLTRLYLEENLEPVPAFQHRRLNWYRWQYYKETGTEPPGWLLRRLAGLS